MAFPKPRSLKNGRERGLALPASMQVAQMWDVPMKETEGDSFSLSSLPLCLTTGSLSLDRTIWNMSFRLLVLVRQESLLL